MSVKDFTRNLGKQHVKKKMATKKYIFEFTYSILQPIKHHCAV